MYKIPEALSKNTQGGGRTDASSDVISTTRLFVRFNQQPTSWSSSTGNLPTFGAPCQAPQSKPSPIDLLELPTPPLVLGPRQLLKACRRAVALAPASTGGSTTNSYIAQPGTAYASTGHGHRWKPQPRSVCWSSNNDCTIRPTPRNRGQSPTSHHQGISININRLNFPLSLPATLPLYPYEACHRLSSLLHM